MGLIRVQVEFRFGIHNFHSTITHLSVTGVLVGYVVVQVLRLQLYYFSLLEKDIILRIVISSFRECLWVQYRGSGYGFSAYPESPSKIPL